MARKKIKRNRRYPDGEIISNNLPSAYGLPPKGYENQICHNCIFYKNDHCTYWDAPVRDEYWCKKWKAIDTEIDIKMEAPEYKPPTTPKGPRSYSSIKSSGGGGGY